MSVSAGRRGASRLSTCGPRHHLMMAASAFDNREPQAGMRSQLEAAENSTYENHDKNSFLSKIHQIKSKIIKNSKIFILMSIIHRKFLHFKVLDNTFGQMCHHQPCALRPLAVNTARDRHRHRRNLVIPKHKQLFSLLQKTSRAVKSDCFELGATSGIGVSRTILPHFVNTYRQRINKLSIHPFLLIVK